MAFRVIDACGQPVQPGDVVYDFKGDHAVFLHVARGADPLRGTLAKVMVERANRRLLFFAHTFDLRIEEVSGAEG